MLAEGTESTKAVWWEKCDLFREQKGGGVAGLEEPGVLWYEMGLQR